MSESEPTIAPIEHAVAAASALAIACTARDLVMFLEAGRWPPKAFELVASEAGWCLPLGIALAVLAHRASGRSAARRALDAAVANPLATITGLAFSVAAHAASESASTRGGAALMWLKVELGQFELPRMWVGVATGAVALFLAAPRRGRRSEGALLALPFFIQACGEWVFDAARFTPTAGYDRYPLRILGGPFFLCALIALLLPIAGRVVPRLAARIGLHTRAAE